MSYADFMATLGVFLATYAVYVSNPQLVLKHFSVVGEKTRRFLAIQSKWVIPFNSVLDLGQVAYKVSKASWPLSHDEFGTIVFWMVLFSISLFLWGHARTSTETEKIYQQILIRDKTIDQIIERISTGNQSGKSLSESRQEQIEK